jgi:hypothetical protein
MSENMSKRKRDDSDNQATNKKRNADTTDVVSDICKVLGLSKGINIEIEYDDDKWCPATVENTDTGTIHTFYDTDTETETETETDNGVEVPIVQVHAAGDRRPTDVCIVNSHVLFDIGKEELFTWKKFGEPVNDGQNTMIYHSHDTFKAELDELVTHMFLDGVKCNPTLCNNDIPANVMTSIASCILTVKSNMVEKLLNHFETNGTMVPGTVVVLDVDTVDQLRDQLLDEFEWNT